MGFAATSYPVSGKWTYETPRAWSGENMRGPRTMTFDGDTRYNTGGGVPEFKNKSSVQTGAGLYRIVDTFYNGQTWGNVNYTLRLPDPDHIEITYVKGGSSLRRCS